MSPDTDDRTPAQSVRAADQSDEMEQRLDQLDEHIADASKKAQAGRPQGSPQDGDVLDDVAGGGTDNAGEADDPEKSPIMDTE
jgi:hypothetical protein